MCSGRTNIADQGGYQHAERSLRRCSHHILQRRGSVSGSRGGSVAQNGEPPRGGFLFRRCRNQALTLMSQVLLRGQPTFNTAAAAPPAASSTAGAPTTTAPD